jgi:hypothetical protein
LLNAEFLVYRQRPLGLWAKLRSTTAPHDEDPHGIVKNASAGIQVF